MTMTDPARPLQVHHHGGLHPLEPLSASELAAAADVCRTSPTFTPTMRFVFIELSEPPKVEVLSYVTGDLVERRAFCVLRDPASRSTHEAVVSVTTGEVLWMRQIDGAQPPMMLEEFMACEQTVQADPRWQEAMRARGVTDFALTMVDPWASGYLGPDDDPAGTRLARPLTFVRASPEDNGYARPVENLLVTVDMDTMTVIDVTDLGVVPLPPMAGNYLPELLFEPDQVPAFETVREPMKPLEVVQSEGPSFTVDGHHVRWANWRLRIGWTPREGLVLHDLGFVDHGRLRPVMYRASLSEMYVPYGDPTPTHAPKNVFDEGEYGLGVLANPLRLGCDCLGEIRYFDAVMNDQDGAPMVIENAICMHEEDAGIAWKHTDFRTGRPEVRRMRKLVISFIATVGNYEYGFYWNLYLDGTIEFEVKLTGIISTGALPVGETSPYGTMVAPGLFGPNHQHYFSVRMDMRVDGDRNNLHEVDSLAVPPGPDNTSGTAWVTRKTQLTSELGAARVADPFAMRAWLVSSADTTTALGGRPAYKIEPGTVVVPLWQEGSQQADRAAFATKNLWATAFADRERYAAGEYVAQNPGHDGLEKWTKADRSLVDADLVLWYTLGAHHVVRPEDWPVMPVTKIAFHLKPSGFFDGNPVLDLAPTVAHGASDSGSCCATEA